MVVIVYNKALNESTTLQSLLTFTHAIQELVIVNNGPEQLDEDEFFFCT